MGSTWKHVYFNVSILFIVEILLSDSLHKTFIPKYGAVDSFCLCIFVNFTIYIHIYYTSMYVCMYKQAIEDGKWLLKKKHFQNLGFRLEWLNSHSRLRLRQLTDKPGDLLLIFWLWANLSHLAKKHSHL